MSIQGSNIARSVFVTSFLCVAFFSQQYSQCQMRCSYKEDKRQANCERRSLETIPIECTDASYLSLRYNHIFEIEPGIFSSFHFLRELILSYNDISRIDANAFTGAPQLKSIKLRYNYLQTVNQYALNGTENLQYIYLSRNYLSAMKEGTFQLAPKLEVIELSVNHLSHLTHGVFGQLKNLKRLHLDMNILTDLHADIFKDLSSLVYLDLSNNLLFTLPADLFTSLVSVKTIDLSGNRLIAVDNIFNLPNMHVLDLHNNNLEQLGNASLQNWTSRAEKLFIYLEGNPWTCDCSLEPFRFFCLHGSHSFCKIIDAPVCSSPPSLASHTLRNLNRTLCPPPHITSTAAIAENESHVNTTTGVGKSENSSHPVITLFVLIPVVCLLIMIFVWRRCNRGATNYHLDKEHSTVLEPLTKRLCEMTPSKRPSQNPPAPPSKKNSDSGSGGIENGERNGCRKNLFDESV